MCPQGAGRHSPLDLIPGLMVDLGHHNALPFKAEKPALSMLASPGNKAPCFATESPPDEPGSPERHYRPEEEDDPVIVAQHPSATQPPAHHSNVTRR